MKNKKRALSMRWLLCSLGFLGGGGVVLMQKCCSAEGVHFTPVFPSSAYTHVLEICGELCSSLEALAACSAADGGCQLLIDVLNGRILRLQTVVGQFIAYHAKNPAMYEGDGAYILRLLHDITSAYRQCHAERHGGSASTILNTLQQQLHELFMLPYSSATTP